MSETPQQPEALSSVEQLFEEIDVDDDAMPAA